VLFIKLLLLFCGFPESHKVVVLSLLVVAHLEDDGVQTVSNPADGSILFGAVRALVEIVRMGKESLRLLESDSSLRIGS
jgi:phage-related holin